MRRAHRILTAFNLCLLCDMPSRALVCQVCEHDMLWHADRDVIGDVVCQAWVHPRLSHLKCDRLYCLDKYRYPLTYMVPLIKFHQRPDIVTWCANQWLAVHANTDSVRTRHALLSVPLHPSRERTRGYNQAGLLAQHLSHHTGIVHLAHAVTRMRATQRQSELTQSERMNNVSDVFCVDAAALTGITRVAIIDDVVTTGATINAMCHALFTVAPHLYIDVWCIALADLS